MINPSFSDTLTLFHRENFLDEKTKKTTYKWIRTVYQNCYFGTEAVRSLSGTTLNMADSYIVRIPCLSAMVSVGDIVIKGNVSEDITDEQGQRSTDMLNRHKPNAFTVRTVSYNTKIPQSAHIRLTGV